MSRRTLPKLDPALDLSRSLQLPGHLPQPWDQRVLFGRQAPLEIEVGSGKGLFLSQAAKARPGHDFLGIELAQKYARYSAARLAKQQLANACMVHGDAEKIFAEILPPDIAAAVHVYFPDPWWKARHRKRRVMNSHFLLNAVRVLVPGGTLHFWTDVEEYYRSAVELIVAEIPLAGPFEVQEHTAEHNLDFRTHFERRMRLHGEAVYRTEFRKAARE
ncbi:MAG TPA: tRNA (guanosine(46)-N7)-methyltransferase TrmB [Pirellulales bacterium]|jgi:tRNA (guanine-N7-)-methyltransferase